MAGFRDLLSLIGVWFGKRPVTVVTSIAQAIYNKLSGDAALVAKLGAARIYHVTAPQGVDFPYIVFGLKNARQLSTFANQNAIDVTTWWVHIFAEDAKEAGEIYDIVDPLLNDATLTVTGYTHLKTKRTFTSTISVFDQAFRIPIQYLILVDKI